MTRLIDFLNREIDSKRHIIFNGLCPDYTSYRSVVAELKSFQMVLEEIKKIEASEDDIDA